MEELGESMRLRRGILSRVCHSVICGFFKNKRATPSGAELVGDWSESGGTVNNQVLSWGL